VSCVSPGNCAAGGDYENVPPDGDPEIAGFVAVQRNGRWGQAINVPGLKALTKVGGDVASVSCGSPGHCTAGGYYTGSRGHQQGFVT
jgi:hypothetical protein